MTKSMQLHRQQYGVLVLLKIAATQLRNARESETHMQNMEDSPATPRVP